MKQQVLKQAIEKAEKNGWDRLGSDLKSDWPFYLRKDFAKALWGEEPQWYLWADEWKQEMICGAAKEYNWERHLQEMVISEDPIQYLKENI